MKLPRRKFERSPYRDDDHSEYIVFSITPTSPCFLWQFFVSLSKAPGLAPQFLRENLIVSVISAVTLVARRQRLNELSAKKKMNLYYVDRVVVTVSD